MNHKILFVDLDATLLSDDKTVSEENRAAIQKMLLAGHDIVLSPGRPVESGRAVARELELTQPGCYMIAFNGAVLYDCAADRVLLKRSLPIEVTQELFERAAKAGIYAQTYNNTEIITTRHTAELEYYRKKTGLSYKLSANVLDLLEEGACTAWQLHELGYAAFILRYRVWTDASDDAPLEDIGRAMQYIEEHAAEFGIQPEQYAIVGYSMGGHLTGLFGTESVGYQHYNVPKPAALLLGYPINDMTYIKPIYHVIQDIGAYGPKYYTRNLSDEITPDYPATYHWHGVNDTLLKELVYWRQGPQLEAALQANHVKHVYRVFNNAPHVCGIGTGTDAENWLVEATAFWEEQCA